jgi:indole-3-glycerol phosphate synthase
MGGDATRPYTRQPMGVLDEILAAKRAELALLQNSEARDTLRRAALDAPPARDFAGALRRQDGRLAVVGEIKRRSPSKGDLAPDLDPAVVAKSYETGGAAALSVLTDRPFFGGSVDDLQKARATVELPALRKDFTIDETQVYEARAIGADAVLLIVAALPDDALLAELRALADEVGIVALVEAHDEAELDRALAAGAAVVGVNARDLGTFGEDLGLSERLADRIPADVAAVAESAIRAPEDAGRMADAGYDAVLVGEALVRSENPIALVHAMTEHSVRPRR